MTPCCQMSCIFWIVLNTKCAIAPVIKFYMHVRERHAACLYSITNKAERVYFVIYIFFFIIRISTESVVELGNDDVRRGDLY